MTTRQAITVLGSTGSIGTSTLDVVSRHPQRFSVFALSANHNDELLVQQCLAYQPKYAVLMDADAGERLQKQLRKEGSATEVRVGEQGLCQIAADRDVDVVMAAIVGGAGLQPTLAAVRAGKKVLLANKESLVMAGALFMSAVREHGATLLPIDSEHNAIFQCLPRSGEPGDNGVRKILLTASGGPFYQTPLAELEAVTPDQACQHPNWTMGRKISVDSATMMNKGLELIEACHLFGLSPDKIEVVIHPQSVIHSMVDYVDGSVLAQLGNPDMRTPIAHALAWPERIDSGVTALDVVAQARLDFCAPDLERFPCLALAMQAAKTGGAAPVALNAANEVAVAAFLNQDIGFLDIAPVIAGVLNQAESWAEPNSLEQVHTLDTKARELAQTACADVGGDHKG